ncbi:hypothetical protein BGZ80_002114 [Entomortierella chlamydospora]|uniref:Uncharacterized protein n=1 Tax=Entomortierella chlamydospora TaxID=101097 RepID=A0A9P6T3C8_9FUNG|nr:hypothetical protein BGZ80_002114 [Entomortierella chlamydospora]
MSEKTPCPSFWRIVEETKVFINKLLDKLPASHSSLTPYDSAAGSYDSIQETINQYTSLWEVQLALGEIPGMFEENILQPCQPRNQLQSTQQPQFQPSYYQQDQSQQQMSSQQFTFPDFSSITSSSEMTSIEDFPEQSLGYYSNYECDQEEFEENDEYLWPSFSPLQNDGITKSDMRHDRKDSGIFVHDDEGAIIQISPKSRNVESRSGLLEWYGSDVDEFACDNMTIEGHISAQRSHAMGENFSCVKVGSFTLPPPLSLVSLP